MQAVPLAHAISERVPDLEVRREKVTSMAWLSLTLGFDQRVRTKKDRKAMGRSAPNAITGENR